MSFVPVHSVHSFLLLSHDSNWWKLVRLKILSPLWPLCILDPMLFCVSTLSCATKIANALILLGQENPLVLVPELRRVRFWSLELSGWLPPMFGPDCGYSPLVSREVVSKNLKWYVYHHYMHYELYAICIMKCKPANEIANCVFRHK